MRMEIRLGVHVGFWRRAVVVVVVRVMGRPACIIILRWRVSPCRTFGCIEGCGCGYGLGKSVLAWFAAMGIVEGRY